MEGMGSFEALASSGSRAAFGDEGVGVAEALGVLAAYVREEGRLRAEGTWELHRDDAQLLAARSGVVPDGGWARLVGLAAGAQVLRARDGGFEDRKSVV